MVLREAFRYQNFLDHILGEAESYLRNSNNYMIVTEKHLKSNAVAGAVDEEKDNLADRPLSVKPGVVVSFMMRLFDEKEILSKAINDAMTQHCKEMNNRLALNRIRHSIIEVLKSMAQSKPRESIKRGSAFTMNAEGNQVPYYYDIECSTEIDFDRFEVKRLISKLSAESDKVSTTIDYWTSSIPVEYSPVFDINDSFEELVESYNLTMA